jgi:hypothetical protein
LYCTIRWIAGGSYLGICDISGILKSSFYRVVWKTIRVIVACQGLGTIQWPGTQEAVQKVIEGFATITTQGVISNCTGVVDGYLLRIKVPGKKEVGNVRSYFSGHYQCYGVNIQACCNHLSHFTYIAMTAPGVMGDHIAIHECSLYELIEMLPFGICVMGDTAYEATEHMVPSYQNLDRRKPLYDNFNYYCSQCRIRIEMAFGMLQMKWGILQRPLGAKLKNIRWLLSAVAWLHNFCIDQRLLEAKGNENDPVAIDEVEPSRAATMYLPSIPLDKHGNPIELGAFTNECLHGHSELRKIMSKRVRQFNLKRPASSAARMRLSSDSSNE